MTIKRVINGETVEIELTMNELVEAHRIVERNTWEYMIKDKLEEEERSTDIDPEIMQDMLNEIEERINDFDYSLDGAIEYVIEMFIDEDEEGGEY